MPWPILLAFSVGIPSKTSRSSSSIWCWSIPNLTSASSALKKRDGVMNLQRRWVKRWRSLIQNQVAYNEHYKRWHSGLIEERVKARQKKRLKLKKEKAEKRHQVKFLMRMKRNEGWIHCIGKEFTVNHQAEALKTAESEARRRDQRGCAHCSNAPPFANGYLRDCHLVSHHHYDLCQLCGLIGPAIEVSNKNIKTQNAKTQSKSLVKDTKSKKVFPDLAFLYNNP